MPAQVALDNSDLITGMIDCAIPTRQCRGPLLNFDSDAFLKLKFARQQQWNHSDPGAEIKYFFRCCNPDEPAKQKRIKGKPVTVGRLVNLQAKSF